jgi:hypothetical protein
MALMETRHPLNRLSCVRICAGPYEGCRFFNSSIADSSVFDSRCPGSRGAYIDIFTESLPFVIGFESFSFVDASNAICSSVTTLPETTAAGIVPLFAASRTHRLTDSTVVPSTPAASLRFIPDDTSVNTWFFSASVYRIPLGPLTSLLLRSGLFFDFFLMSFDVLIGTSFVGLKSDYRGARLAR